MKINYYIIAVAASISLNITSRSSSYGQAPAKKPNILIILADDLGYHDVSYYNTPDVRTPNIDQLCKAGIHFDNFYANSPVCSPSRASIMCGRYPEMVGVPGLIRSTPTDNFSYLLPGVQTLPMTLKKAGYKTAIVGKWNLGLASPNLPNQKGFDYFHGWLDDMMDDYWKHLRLNKNALRENDKTIQVEGHATDLFTNWSIDYLNKAKAEKEPFFLYLAYNAPHDPLQPPPDFLAKVKARQPGISEKRGKLVALIEHMDEGIGKVIAALKQNKQYDNTIIIFVSDNGGLLADEANNGPLRDGKGNMYEGGLRVPALVVWPGHIAPGSTSTEKLMHMDIYPTLAEIANIKIEHKIDGVSFLAVLKNSKAQLAPRPLFFIRREGGGGFSGKTSNAVQSGNFKLLQTSPYLPLEMYDLSTDPYEKYNIINNNQPMRQMLNKLMMKQTQSGGSVPWQKGEMD